MAAETFTCALCRGVFEKAWSDAEAESEYASLWSDAPGPVDVICEDCFQKFHAWAKSDGHVNA